jgi:hypothetical protein
MREVPVVYSFLRTLLDGALPWVTLDAAARHPLEGRILNAAQLLLAASVRKRSAVKYGFEVLQIGRGPEVQVRSRLPRRLLPAVQDGDSSLSDQGPACGQRCALETRRKGRCSSMQITHPTLPRAKLNQL